MGNQQMNNQKTVLTALGCAGSLAAVLAIGSPALAGPVTELSSSASEDALTVLVQDEDANPIFDALRCTCAVCTGGIQQPTF